MDLGNIWTSNALIFNLIHFPISHKCAFSMRKIAKLTNWIICFHFFAQREIENQIIKIQYLSRVLQILKFWKKYAGIFWVNLRNDTIMPYLFKLGFLGNFFLCSGGYHQPKANHSLRRDYNLDHELNKFCHAKNVLPPNSLFPS